MQLDRIQRNLFGIIVLLCLLIAWEMLARIVHSPYLPTVSAIVVSFCQNILSTSFMTEHALPGLGRMLLGYTIAAVTGISFGVILGCYPGVLETLDPCINFLRSLPSAAIIPIGILLLGISDSMKVFVVFFGTFWPILINSIDGAKSTHQEFLDTATSFGIGRLDIILYVIFPSALPMIFAGLRVSLSLALIMMVISETKASTNGIGYYLLTAQRTYRIPEMFASIALLGIVAYVLNAALTAIEDHILFWQHRQ